MPEWDDAVDANYDFETDEHSTVGKASRERHYIWDIFDYAEVPIDGVLISREQIESSPARVERALENGVYEDSNLGLPEWLPTISDCGAWGYKSLPFPRYGNIDMLDFYEKMDVTTGVTIDHLVLGSGHQSRLYLDERAFGDQFTPDDVPEILEQATDVMIEPWPSEWPEYVEEYAPHIAGVDDQALPAFDSVDFAGPPEAIIDRLRDDPRAVYRDDDMQFRYDLTLANARKMWAHYDDSYSFRLMAAIQGWNPESYCEAARQMLDLGYGHLGAGGLAGSSLNVVEEVVSALGRTITNTARETKSRIDFHVFGFAKPDGFETIGRSGVSSFDSASMLRSAWTGGNNYHLGPGDEYDAIRVRFARPQDDLDVGVRKALHGQEVLYSLRAYDQNRSISQAITDWHNTATAALESLEQYLREYRTDERFNHGRIRDVERAFRADFDDADIIRASFGRPFRRRLIKFLQQERSDDPLEFDRYAELLELAESELAHTPRTLDIVKEREPAGTSSGTFEQLWPVVENYASAAWIEDTDYLEAYRQLLRRKPWTECSCRICNRHGIEVAIFRGNNRNRRRGFHNTWQFYQQFDEALPKTLVALPATATLLQYDTIEEYLMDETPEFWEAVHDLPVVEIGVITADAVHEWWASTPASVSVDPDGLTSSLERVVPRYSNIHVFVPAESSVAVPWSDVDVHGREIETWGVAETLRSNVLDHLGYEDRFLPQHSIQAGLEEF